MDPLQHGERQVVNLLALGFAPTAIARHLALSQQHVKRVIGDLCAEYDCAPHELPDEVPQPDHEVSP